MKLRIDSDNCTGHGRCYALAPDLFDADDAGYGWVKDKGKVVPDELEDQAKLAVANCPERAIYIDD